jgi:hypothetical protein
VLENSSRTKIWEDKVMVEKRRAKRIPVDMKLEISNLFKQDNVMIKNIDAPVRVVNISRGGIGFESQALLPVGYYFNSKIELGDSSNSLYTVVQIVRVEKREDSVFYGCEFIGMAPVLGYIFEEFENSIND